MFLDFLDFSGTRLEIISDVVSERHVAEKFLCQIGNTDTTSVFSDNTSVSDVVSEKTDVVSEKTDVVSVFPMWYRNFSATCLFRYHIGNYF